MFRPPVSGRKFCRLSSVKSRHLPINCRRDTRVLGIGSSILLLLSLLMNFSTALAQDFEALDATALVVVKVYFDDIKVAQKISKTFEPRQSNYTNGYLVLQESKEDIQRLMSLSGSLGVRVEYDQQATLAEQLKDQGIGLQPSPRGLRPKVQRQTQLGGQIDGSKLPDLVFAGIPSFSCYRTVEETFASAEEIVAQYPNLASWTDVGDSWEKTNGFGGYDLNVLRLTNKSIAGPKPTIFITSAIHAREYTTAELMTRFAEYLVASYNDDADITWILDHTDVRMMLVTNPDGRKRAETGILWRKNTNQNYCGATSNSRGADLNRNFPFNWGCCNGSSGSQCNTTYRGPFAASEPETQAVINQLRSIFPDSRGPNINDAAPLDTSGIYLDIHSSGRLLLWPWGSISSPAPNGPELQTLGRKLAYFNGHAPQQAIGLYPTDGTTDGAGYGELGIASYTYELGTEFFESCSYFENTLIPDNFPSLLYALKSVRAPYLLPAGPEGVGLTLSPIAPNGVPAGTDVEIQLTFDDTRYNNSNGSEPSQAIAAAEYYIDVPPWENGASGAAITMTASDGSFNSSVESVQATIDTSALSEGRHTIYTRGRDAAGNWGVVSAAFLTIDNNATVPSVIFEDDFETDLGWQPNPSGSDTATTGQWQRANPEATSSGGALQLGDTVSGVFGLITGPQAGASVGANDIDSGVTSVRSPDFVLPAGSSGATLSFYSYLAHTSNSSPDDFLRVSAVGSSGSTLLFEELGGSNQDNASWTQTTVSLQSFAGQSIFLLIEAADGGGGSLVEAAVDDVVVSASLTGGSNNPPTVDAGTDQSLVLPGSVNLNGSVSDDGQPNPPGQLSLAWSKVSGPGTVSFANSAAVDTSATFSAAGIYTLRLTASDSQLQSSDTVQVTVTTASADCPAGSIDFNSYALEAYSNQDLSGGAAVSSNGAELTLTGNAWKRSLQSYSLTAGTLLQFEYASSVQGEIHGIGFDQDQDLNNDARLFQFWGTQTWNGGGAITSSLTYTGGGAFQNFSIPIGNSYTGNDYRLVLVNDKDSGTPDNQGVFRCVRVIEPIPATCSFEESFESGASGWSNSPASTCSTGSFSVGSPTEVTVSGVTTQVAGDHTTGTGNALFTAPNSSAGADDVDGGECIIESPSIPTSNASQFSAWYFHGQRDAGDDPSGDFFALELSLNGGSTWNNLVSTGDQSVNATWTQATAAIPAGSNVKLRMRVADGAADGDLIEAGLDDVAICESP